MDIILIGYRDWALKAFSLIKFRHVQIKSESEFEFFISTKFSANMHLVFVGWSKIIPASVVSHGNCYCIHPSDLPKYRGGSPIQNQVLEGVLDTKLTLFRMNEYLDAGPVLSKTDLCLRGPIPSIFNNMTSASVLLLEDFAYRINDAVFMKGTVQDENLATILPRRKPEQSEITLDDLSRLDSNKLLNKINALGDPYPNAFIRTVDGRKLLIKTATIE